MSILPGNNYTSPTPVLTEGASLFYIVVNNTARTFTVDDIKTSNGMKIHYEMMQVARKSKYKLLDFDIRADHMQDAISKMQSYFFGFKHAGIWGFS